MGILNPCTNYNWGMKEEICCITNKGKAAKYEWENDDSDFPQALFSVYKKIG